jgi:MFS transporter, PAT family, beta-lactamase induction signal transducer AmpG
MCTISERNSSVKPRGIEDTCRHVNAANESRGTPRAEGFAYRMRWVAILYFAQGFPFGVFRDVWPVYFRQHGVSLKEVGLLSLLGLPYTLKPLWAPLVDRFGDRRAWIAACLIAMAALFALHPLFDASRPSIVLWGVLIAFMFASATQDIAIDAHTIAFIPRGEEGNANGMRVTAARVAIIISGGLLLLVADRLGWTTAFLLGAAALLCIAPIVLRAPAPELNRAERRRFLGPLLLWLQKPGSLPTLFFILLYKIGDTTIGMMTKPFWVDRGISLTKIGLINTTLGVAMTIAGAMLGGWITTRIGLMRGLLAMGVAQVLPNLGYAAVAAFPSPHGAVYAASMLESFGQGMGTAAFLSLLMRLCDREHAATEYAVLSALFAVSRDVSGAVSGWATKALGYPTFFLYTFFLGFPALLLLPWVKRRVEAAVPREA